MMVSLLVMFAGVVVVVLMATPQTFGIAVSPGFGPAQLVGTAAGAVLIIAGLASRFATSRLMLKQIAGSRVGLVVLGVLGAMVLVEVGLLALATAAPSRDPTGGDGLRQPVEDSRLVLRLPPNVEGHDALGFRNETVPDDVDIVVIGDSQTWGINARRDEAWPQVLEQLTGRATYNMGLGYYGTAQYWVLAQEAVTLSPEIVVIGLYFGNDIWGAYETVYSNETYEQFRDARLVAELSIDTIGPAVRELSRERVEYVDSISVGAFSGLIEWLVDYSGIVGLLSRQGWWFGVGDTARATAAIKWTQAFPDRGDVYESDGYTTVFTSAYRLMALDTSEPRIAEGLRVTNDLLSAAKAGLEAEGVQMLVVLIPTKESVFASLMRQSGSLHAGTLSDLIDAEAMVRAQVVQRLEADGTPYVDALPALSAAAQKGEYIYRRIEDGHPTPAGYTVIAKVVASALAGLGW